MKTLNIFCLNLFLLTIISSCSIGQTSITFTIKESVTIQNSKVTVSLFGHDDNYADVSADLICEKEFTIESLPSTITLEIPNNPYSLITHGGENKNDVKFYISTEWDSNNDGKKTSNGDLFPDFDEKFPNIELGTNNTIPLLTIKH